MKNSASISALPSGEGSPGEGVSDVRICTSSSLIQHSSSQAPTHEECVRKSIKTRSNMDRFVVATGNQLEYYKLLS